MAQKIDLIAPKIEKDSSALTLVRWLKQIGDAIMLNEPLAEIKGAEARGYVHSPAEGTLSTINIRNGQSLLSGSLMGQIAVISKKDIDWGNFDQVTALLEEFAEKSKDPRNLKDTNEALGQLLGVADKDVFRQMSVENQNKFLQNVVDQHSQNGLSAADIAQKLLEGLALRNPKVSGPAVRGPAMGMAIPTPGGNMVGGNNAQPPQQWPQLEDDKNKN